VNKSNNNVNKELSSLGQGKRLTQFRIEKKFKSRLAFAKELKISVTTINDVENNLRKISKNLIAVIVEKWNDTNDEWLLYGNPPKLLTENSVINLSETVEEAGINYNQKCLNCISKDQIIEKLKTEISELRKEYIECLKEVSVLKKASSG
jgi:hypothetical protein